MPVYTYYCEACGTTFDQRLSFNDPHPTRCPQCGAEALHRVYKPVGIVFKGSGFYATDHRSPSGSKNNKPSDNGASSEKTKEAPKSETPAKKAETSPAKATASAPPAKTGEKA